MIYVTEISKIIRNILKFQSLKIKKNTQYFLKFVEKYDISFLVRMQIIFLFFVNNIISSSIY